MHSALKIMLHQFIECENTYHTITMNLKQAKISDAVSQMNMKPVFLIKRLKYEHTMREKKKKLKKLHTQEQNE